MNRLKSECEVMKEEMARIDEYWSKKGITIDKIKQYLLDRSELEMEINQVTEKCEETEKERVLLENEIIRIRKEVKKTKQNKSILFYLLIYVF